MKRTIKVVDLSMLIAKDMALFPGMGGPSLTRTKTHKEQGLQSTRIEMSVHAGTHIDSKYHFSDGGTPIAQVPLDKFIGEAVVLDLKFKSPRASIVPDDFGKYAQKIQRGDIVILHTGCETYSDPTLYCPIDPDAARWLVRRDIKCLATDTPSLDPVPKKGLRASDGTHPAHHIILQAGIPIIENLNNLGSLKKGRVFFLCLPLKISDAEAAPARAIAIDFAP